MGITFARSSLMFNAFMSNISNRKRAMRLSVKVAIERFLNTEIEVGKGGERDKKRNYQVIEVFSVSAESIFHGGFRGHCPRSFRRALQ